MAHDPPVSSADDALEEVRSNQMPQKAGQKALPEDNDTPAAPSKNPYLGSLPEDQPETDTRLDETAVYNEDKEGAVLTPENPDVSNHQSDIPRTRE